MSRQEAAKHITKQRQEAMRIPVPGEICGAYARSTGQPCRAPAGANGRCKLHGGKSTGPRTPEGLAKTVEAMQSGLKQWRESSQLDE